MYITEYKAVIKATVSGEWREPLQIFIINMSHDGEHIDADMKKGETPVETYKYNNE